MLFLLAQLRSQTGLNNGDCVCMCIYLVKNKQKDLVGYCTLLVFLKMKDLVKRIACSRIPFLCISFWRHSCSSDLVAQHQPNVWKILKYLLTFEEQYRTKWFVRLKFHMSHLDLFIFSLFSFYVLAWCENCQSCCLPQLCKSQARSRGCPRSSKEKEACLGVSHLSMELNVWFRWH